MSGDTIEVESVGGRRHSYVVDTVWIVDETGATVEEKQEHARWLDPTVEPVLTLVTCWPDWSYTHRVVVRAKLSVR